MKRILLVLTVLAFAFSSGCGKKDDDKNKKTPVISLYYDGSNETLACYSYNSRSDELERIV